METKKEGLGVGEYYKIEIDAEEIIYLKYALTLSMINATENNQSKMAKQLAKLFNSLNEAK